MQIDEELVIDALTQEIVLSAVRVDSDTDWRTLVSELQEDWLSDNELGNVRNA